MVSRYGGRDDVDDIDGLLFGAAAAFGDRRWSLDTVGRDDVDDLELLSSSSSSNSGQLGAPVLATGGNELTLIDRPLTMSLYILSSEQYCCWEDM